MENVGRFFILLAVAIAVRMLGRRFVPLVMPESRLKTVVVGMVGGLVGQWLGGRWGIAGIEVAGLYLVWVVAGTAMAVLLLGLAPFIKVFLGKT